MQFFDWLDRQIANSYYWYADDFEWPMGYFPGALSGAFEQNAAAPAETAPADPNPDSRLQ